MNERTRPVDVLRQRAAEAIPSDGAITVLSWNLGYAGLGCNEDFATDGGGNLSAHLKEQRQVVRRRHRRMPVIPNRRHRIGSRTIWSLYSESRGGCEGASRSVSAPRDKGVD